MSTLSPPHETSRTVADIVAQLGDIPLERIRVAPPIGHAVEADVVANMQPGRRPCELIDGVLVEKAMGLPESVLGAALIEALRKVVRANNLGFVAGADGTMRLFQGAVRVPDVAFIGWDRLPEGRFPDEPVPDLVPDLAVEVFSRGNTQAEMERKCADYFSAGVRLVWIVYPRRRTVEVLRQNGDSQTLAADDHLRGEDVVPGFDLSLRELFGELDRTP